MAVSTVSAPISSQKLSFANKLNGLPQARFLLGAGLGGLDRPGRQLIAAVVVFVVAVSLDLDEADAVEFG